MRVQVRVQKKYFFEFKFKFGKMIEFFRVQVRSPAFSPEKLSHNMTDSGHFTVGTVYRGSKRSDNLGRRIVIQCRPRGYCGTVRYGITARLDFGKKYDTELRTEFLEKVRYGTEIRDHIFRTVLFPYSSNARFALLLPSTALFLLAYDFTPSVALAVHTHQESPLTIF